MVAPRTSLEKLQALDKEYKTLDEQLNALRNILHIRELPTGRSICHWDATSSLPERLSQGRASFSLRWLLNKMRSSSSMRTAPNAWIMLTIICHMLPAHAASRLLVAAGFSAIVQQAILSLATDRDERGTANPSKSSTTAVAMSVDNDSDNAEGKEKRKRKRHEVAPPARLAKRRRSDESITKTRSLPDLSSQASLTYAVATCAGHVSRLSVSVTHVIPPLKTDIESASKILGATMTAFTRLFNQGHVTIEECNSLMSPFIEMWEQYTVSDPNSKICSQFAENALLPTCNLLASVQQANDHGSSGNDRALASQLERLIAKHVFVPARSAFHQIQSTSIEFASSTSRLKELLNISLIGVPTSSDEQAVNTGNTMPLLFSIAIRCTSRSSMKRRLAEDPWLEEVFTILMDNIASQWIDLADELLVLAKHHHIKLGRKVLLRTVSHFCGNAAPITTYSQWSLISSVLALDDQVFLRQSKQHNASEAESVLDQVLRSLATSVPKLRSVSHTTHTEDSMRSEVGKDSYQKIRDGIIEPLMKAHVKARDLVGFIHLWHNCLKECYTSSGSAQSLAASIWENQKLKDVLSGLLESSITSKTLLGLVDDFVGELEVSEADDESPSLCFASAGISTAILGACRSDEYVSAVSPLAQVAMGKALRLICNGRLGSSSLKRALWRLAGASAEIWWATAPSAEIESDPLLRQRKPSLALCTESLETIEEHLEALACLSRMHVALTSRHIDSKSIEAGTLPSLQYFISSGTASVEQEIVFASILVKYPSLLDLCDKDKQAAITPLDVLRRIFKATLVLQDRVLQHTWSRLIQRLLDTPHMSPVTALLEEDDSTSSDASSRMARKSLAQMTFDLVRKSTKDQRDATPSDELKATLTSSEEDRLQALQTSIDVASTDYTINSLQALHRLIISASLPNRQGPLSPLTVTPLLNLLITRLQLATDWQTFDYTSAMICILLTHHTRLMSQAVIEDIVTMLHAMGTIRPSAYTKTGSNPTTVDHLAKHPSKVYSRLCHISQILLSLHRRKLAGRFDLLIPMLQALLCCLFTASPTSGAVKPSFSADQPSWLADPRTLKTKHAASYARLLTTLFDPTPSSVAPPKSKSRTPSSSAGMIDHTLAARRTAGQYAPYLLLSLCQLQLDGRFADDGMRDALAPGIWAALDAMDLVDSGGKEQRRGASGRRKGLVDVVHQDAGRVWGVSAAQRTVLRMWWVEWERSRL